MECLQMKSQHSNDECQKAYNQGCLWGLSGRPSTGCPYSEETLTQWWGSGWAEGNEAWLRKQTGQRAAS